MPDLKFINNPKEIPWGYFFIFQFLIFVYKQKTC